MRHDINAVELKHPSESGCVGFRASYGLRLIEMNRLGTAAMAQVVLPLRDEPVGKASLCIIDAIVDESSSKRNEYPALDGRLSGIIG